MRPIVYLASYPRSGNTFLRALLANYLSGVDRPLTPHEIAFFGAGEKHEDLWLESTGLGWRERTIEIEWAARADYLDRVRKRPGTGPVFLKTHTLNGVVLDKPAFVFGPEDRIIYVIRHPLDVLVSAAQFFGLDLPAMADRLMLNGAFNTSDGGYYEITGSWIENVGGWTTETRCPVLLVKFEQLCEDAGGVLSGILRFLGQPPSPHRVARAAADTAFETLQAAHAADGFDQGPGRDARHTFFRVGKTGQWRTEVPAPLAARLVAALGPYMDAFSYEKT